MILCDLPYGTTACKWDNIIPFKPLWEQYNRIIKDNGVIALFGTEPFSSFLRLSNLRNFKYDLIWEKERPTNIMNMKKQFGKVHEVISVFYKKQPTYNPIMEPAKQPKNNNKSKNNSQMGYMNNIETANITSKISDDYDHTKRYPRSVLKFSRGTRHNGFHPTQKPVLLLEYLIRTYTNDGDTVLDNCMGSGSTGVACVNLNRNFIGMELDPQYFGIAKKRIEQAKLKRRGDAE